MIKTFYQVEFPVFTHTRTPEHSERSVTVQIVFEGAREPSESQVEEAAANIADNEIDTKCGGYGYVRPGKVKRWLTGGEEAPFSLTSKKYPGFAVGAVF
jgi:hypothetical protein